MAETNNEQTYECKFATYALSLRGKSDILFIKESVKAPDGTRTPNTRIVTDMKRDFYLTKNAYRDHEDKKDYEEIGKLKKYTCYQWDLPNAISKALGRGCTTLPLKQVCRNPYVYGADIEPTGIVKAMYDRKWPDMFSPFTVSVFDIETDVVDPAHEGEPIMASLTFKEKSYTFVVRRFFNDISSAGLTDQQIIERLQKCADKHIGEVTHKRKMNLEFELVDHPADGFVKLFAKAHEWKPDWVTGWNVLDFDYNVVVDTLSRAGINPADVLCDPSVPPEYRNVYYYPGKSHKVKDDGKGGKSKQALANYEKWPYVNAPASFRWADSMCAYYYLRTAAGKELNYKLDTIAKKTLKGIGKLSFKEAEGYYGRELHEFMQTNHKYEYVVYNVFDCIVVEMMDEVNNDLAISIPTFCGYSDYRNFTSQPTRIAEAMHFDVMESGYIWGTTSDSMRTELDDYIQDLGGWIVMLPTELVAMNGKPMFVELPNVRSYVRTSTNDIDVEGAYPTGTVIMNVGKQTTWLEMTAVEGLDDTEYRKVAVNIAAGGARNNAGEIARLLYKAPTTEILIKEFANENNYDITFLDAA